MSEAAEKKAPALPKMNLRDRVKSLRERANTGIRPIMPIDLLEDFEPNEITATPPTPMTLRPEELWVDAAYQRDLSRKSMELIVSIIQDFDWRKFKPPVVTRDEQGRYLLIDGQHTSIAAATHPGIDKIPVMYVQMEDLRDQAAAFIGHNMSRVNVSALDLYFANLTAQDESTVAIEEAVQKYGVAVRRFVPGSGGTYEPNQTVAIGTMRMLYKKYGSVKFHIIMENVAKCGYSPIKSDHLKAWAILLFHRERGEMELSPEALIEMIKALNDNDALTMAARIQATVRMPRARALAVHYRNKYREFYKGK